MPPPWVLYQSVSFSVHFCSLTEDVLCSINCWYCGFYQVILFLPAPWLQFCQQDRVQPRQTLSCLSAEVSAAQSPVERSGERKPFGAQSPLPPSSPGGGCSPLPDQVPTMALAARQSSRTRSGGSPAMVHQMGFWEQTDLGTGGLLCFQPPLGMQTGTSSPTTVPELSRAASELT